MRDIKFRYLWQGQWYYVDLYQDNTRHQWDLYESRNKTTPFLQFTGLKDGNGIEVYEGDILAREGFNNWVIEWAKSGFHIFNVNNPSNKFFLGNYDLPDRLIIGNIYQNPELL